MAIPFTYVAGSTTDVAPVAALPTTAAHFAILNGESLGGKTYIITSVSCLTTTSAGAVQTLTLLANNLVGPSLGGFTGTAALGPKPLSGQYPPSKGSAYSAVTIVNSGLWHPVAPSVNEGAQTATIGQGVWQYVRGIYYVPPGGIFCLAGFCSAAGSAKCQLFCTWEEVQL